MNAFAQCALCRAQRIIYYLHANTINNKISVAHYISLNPPRFQVYLCIAIDNSHFLILFYIRSAIVVQNTTHTTYTIHSTHIMRIFNVYSTHTIERSHFLDIFLYFSVRMCKILSYVIKWFMVTRKPKLDQALLPTSTSRLSLPLPNHSWNFTFSTGMW